MPGIKIPIGRGIRPKYFGKSWQSYWTPPNKTDILAGGDGTILTVGANKYLRSVNGRNFLITGYDFDTAWTKGIPYKSTATISAPIGDVELIAADVNNFLYDVNGDPIQLPCTSLFQNIDYENKIFFKHIAQVIDANGAETYEPRILEWVIYSSARIGDDLTSCNAYFGVPAKISAIWVSPLGNDTTGTGTEVSPVKTLMKALTLTGTDIYLKTQIEDVGGTGKYYMVSKNIRGIGNCRFINGNPNNYLLRIAGTYLIAGLNLTITGSYISYDQGWSPTYERCVMTSYLIFTSSTGTPVLRNCVMNRVSVTGVPVYFLSQKAKLDTCYIKDNTSNALIMMDYASAGIELDLINNKFYNARVGDNTLLLLNYNSTVINIIGNTLCDTSMINCYNTNITLFNFNYNKGSFGFLELSGTGTGIVNVIGNKLSSADANTKFKIKNKDFNCTHNNIINTGTGGIIAINSTINYITATIQNNRFYGTIGCAIGTVEAATYPNYVHGCYKYNLAIKPADDPNIYHGVQALNNNFDISFNKHINVNLAFILKGVDFDFSSSRIAYNLAVNGYLILKGANNANVYGNTVLGSVGIVLLENGGLGTLDNNKVKNNIFTKSSADGNVNEWVQDGGHTNVLDYNCLYPISDNIGRIETTEYATLALWQAEGFEEHGLNVDPNIDNNLIPITPIISAENLGADYDDGLDIATDWGDENTVPIVVTKQQGASWQIGAYVQ